MRALVSLFSGGWLGRVKIYQTPVDLTARLKPLIVSSGPEAKSGLSQSVSLRIFPLTL